MQCYSELTPPTAVTHAVSLPFLGPKASNLVVAKTSLLQIFELKSITTEVTTASNGDSDGTFLDGEIGIQRTENTSKLVLLSEYPLSGTVIGLARVKIVNTKAGGEALLIAFKDAKLSLVDWDPETHTLATISVHYYEREELQSAPWAPEIVKSCNYLAVDPNSRCAALKFGQRQLAILPFRQEDIAGDDYDADLDGPLDESLAKKPAPNGNAVNGDAVQRETPYKASKVVPLTRLDPTLTHPIHLAFLHDYREPTFGVLSAFKAPSDALFQIRKDIVSYSIFTLDIETEAYAPIFQVHSLPYDLCKVVPLPSPVGGTLLVGANELVHVDPAGKMSAVAVNSYARKCSAFAMSDQAELGLKLEGCHVHVIADNGDVLIVLASGQLVLLSFKMDGRIMTGLFVHKVAGDKGGQLLRSAPSCVTGLGRNRVFVGSEDGDAVLLGWTRKVTQQLSRKRSHAEMLGGDADSEDGDAIDDEDDLYANDEPVARRASSSAAVDSTPESYSFRAHDALINIGPLRDLTLANHAIVASSGRGRAGGLAIVSTSLLPRVQQKQKLPAAQAIWAFHTKKAVSEEMATLENAEDTLEVDVLHDQFLIASHGDGDGGGQEVSHLYKITSSGIEQHGGGDFGAETEATIAAGTLAGGTRVVQVLQGEIRSYDSEFSLDQMLAMEDEDTGTELKILAAHFCDPHLLVLRDDASAIVLEADPKGAMEELERGEGIKAKKWMSGCIYKSPQTNNNALLFLLSADGGLSIFNIANLDQPVWSTGGIDLLPSLITRDFVPRRSASREAVVELVVADIGDRTSKCPYLVVRTATDDLVLYQPFHYPSMAPGAPFTTNLRWQKVPCTQTPTDPDDAINQTRRQSTLTALRNVGGYSTVFQVGTPSCFIMKEASSAPRVIPLQGQIVRSLTALNTAACEAGFAFVDAGDEYQMCKLPPNKSFTQTGLPTQKIDIGEQVDGLAYHAPTNTFALGTCVACDFRVPNEDHESSKEDASMNPQMDQGVLKLYHPATWSAIDVFALEPFEVITTIKVLELTTSDESAKLKPMLVVGTAVVHGEDAPMKGCIYVFDVVAVVPEPGRPETGFKLKLMARDEVRGAVTAVTELGTQGFLFAAQGQKGMVKAARDDGTMMPTAFIDLQNHVGVAKSLKGTGMALLGDMVKGLWFVGYTEEPYTMKLFGKTRTRMEIVAAEFLPSGRHLYIVAVDSDCDLHVYQYDPENPASLSGQRLLIKSSFHTGHWPTTSTLLPALSTQPLNSTTNGSDPDVAASSQVLVSNSSGSLALLQSLDELSYRRLQSLQEHLHTTLNPTCGLNAAAYRNVESEGFGASGVVDGSFVLRGWAGMGAKARSEASGGIGLEGWGLRRALGAVGRSGWV